MSVLTQVPSQADYQLLVAQAVRILTSLGLMDMNGHVSARDANQPNRMWINSRRASRTTLCSTDVVPVDLVTGSRIGVGDEPPSEYHIHRAIFLRRPDVGAVVHSHTDNIVALSVAGQGLLPVTGVGSFLPESVPVFDDANLVNTRERGDAVADLLRDGPIVVLRGHGAAIVGESIQEALARAVCAEENARIQIMAAALGPPRVLRGEELAVTRRETWKPVIVTKHWHYHEETARRKGAFIGLE